MSNNPRLTINGRPIVGRFGQAITARAAGAPDGDTFGTVTLWSPPSGERYFTLTQASALDSTYTTLRICFYGNQGNARVNTFWPVPASTLDELQAETGEIFLGTERDVLGDLQGVVVDSVQFIPANSSGDGAVLPQEIEDAAADSDEPPSIGLVTIVGDGVVGAVHSRTITGLTGYPVPDLTQAWLLGGSPIGGATGVTYTPVSPGVLAVDVTATNSEGAVTLRSAGMTIVATNTAPAITNATISGSGFIGSPLTVSYNVSGNPVPTVSLQWQLAGVNVGGATTSTYTPTAGGTVSCEISATNSQGSASAEPTKIVSTVPALTAAEWDILTVAAVGATGRRWTRIWIDPAKGATKAWTTTAAPETIINSPWPMAFDQMALEHAGNGWWTPPVAYNINAAPGTGNIGNGVAGGDSTVAGPASITLTATSASSFTVAGAISGTATVGTEFASSGYRFTIVAGTVAFSSGDTFTLDVGTRDFSVFDPSPPGLYTGDTLRQSRAAVVYEIAGGARSPVSEDVKTVPGIPSTSVTVWYPFGGRNAGEFAAGIIGGTGNQNFKNVARTEADPELIWWGLDVNGPVASNDGGRFYYSPQLLGMTIQESSAGIWIDPTDANRILLGVSAADLRSSNTTPNAYDERAGVYLSTDGGATATHVKQLTNIPSNGEKGSRDNRKFFAHLSGGTPTTRTIYYIYKPKPKGGAYANGILYRSTNGGTSWAAHGASLTNANFGDQIYWIDVDPSDDLYIGCDAGLLKSTNGGTSWTSCTGIAGPVGIVNAYHGGTDVWAMRTGNGAYQATNAAATTFLRNGALGAYSITAMAVCPENAGRIVVAEKSSGTNGKWSHNGGSTWKAIVNRSSTGATDDWPSMMCGDVATFSWTPGSQTELLLQRKQHFGKSTDGGASTDWSGNGTDYRTRRGYDCDPGDWRVTIAGAQDTIALGSSDGQNTEHTEGWANAERLLIMDGQPAATGSGGLILRNGSHRAILSACGGDRQARLALHWQESGANPVASLTILGTARSGCEFSGRDAGDTSLGWMGKNRFKLSSAGALSVQKSNMAQEYYGSTSTANRIIGGPTLPGNNRVLYVSTDAGDSWSTWGTSPVRFAVPFGNPAHSVAVSKFHANRVWVGEAYNGTGRLYKMEGASPTNTLIWNLADWPGFDAPETSIHVVRECPSNQTILYVLAYAAGNPFIFRITNATTTPVVTDITENAPLRAISWLHVHPLTDDVITGGQCGSRIHRCHSGSTAPNAGALYDRVKGYVDANVGPGVIL